MSERNGKGTAVKQTGKIGQGKPGPGRPKGSLNKTTASVKDALTVAFAQRGGVASLVTWAGENPTEFYKLWGRMMPTEVEAAVKGGLTIRVVRE